MAFKEQDDMTAHFVEDAIPDPEPAVPSLPKPDPGVYHHEPERPDTNDPENEKHPA